MNAEGTNTRRNTQEDPKGDCRSLGSNCYLSSQSRKMSIGIMVDSATRRQPEDTTGNQVVVSNAEMTNLRKENSDVAKPQDRGVGDLNKGHKSEALEHVSTPWISPRSLRQEILGKETELPVTKASNPPSTKGQRRKLSGRKGAIMERSVHFFSDQHLPSGNSNVKFKGWGGKSKAGDGRNPPREEEFTFATAHDGLASNEMVTGDKSEEKRTETLRVKLWEILGTVSSPKAQPSDCGALAAGPNTSKPVPIFEKDDAAFKPRQHSDTIETDSENTDHVVKRPITRSLMRKKTSTRKPPGKSKAGTSSSCKYKFEGKNSSCRERLSGKGKITVDAGLSISGKKVQEKYSSAEARKIHFSEDKKKDNLSQETHRSETSASAGKRSSADKRTGGFSGFAAQIKEDFTKSKEQNQEKDSLVGCGTNSLQSLETPSKDQPRVDNSPAILADQDQPEDPGYDFQSPTLKMNTPISSSSPCSIPKIKKKDQDAFSPEVSQRILSAINVRSFRSLQKLKGNTSATADQIESLDNAADPKDSHPTRLPYLQEQNVETCLSEPSSEDEDSDGSDEGSSMNEVNLHANPPSAKKQKDAEVVLCQLSEENEDSDSSRENSPNTNECRGTNTSTPEATSAKRSRFLFSPKQRDREQTHNNLDEFSPPLPSRKGPAGSDWIPVLEPSRLSQEDDSQRIIMLFALALKNFKNKMASATKRKSSEILTSVSEEIHQQLKKIESDIHTDLEKLTSVSRSKRKRLEGKFQEQQDRLKLIHDKFKTEIRHHLQDCTSMLEGLEVQQNELKGAMKNQKASHQKLLLQAEKAIQTKLSDAERRITGVQKSAKEKMFLVHRAIAECLNEGGLS